MVNRYDFTVPCPGDQDGQACQGRFAIAALRQCLDEGDETSVVRIVALQNIVELLYGFRRSTLLSQKAFSA